MPFIKGHPLTPPFPKISGRKEMGWAPVRKTFQKVKIYSKFANLLTPVRFFLEGQFDGFRGGGLFEIWWASYILTTFGLGACFHPTFLKMEVNFSEIPKISYGTCELVGLDK